ncbi:MAG: hypothetical protein ACI88A_000659 [Paraglaciecola sp.]
MLNLIKFKVLTVLVVRDLILLVTYVLNYSKHGMIGWQVQCRMIQVPNSAPESVFSFVRYNEKDKVFAVLNLSDSTQKVRFKELLFVGQYTEYFSHDKFDMADDFSLSLTPWFYCIFVK